MPPDTAWRVVDAGGAVLEEVAPPATSALALDAAGGAWAMRHLYLPIERWPLRIETQKRRGTIFETAASILSILDLSGHTLEDQWSQVWSSHASVPSWIAIGEIHPRNLWAAWRRSVTGARAETHGPRPWPDQADNVFFWRGATVERVSALMKASTAPLDRAAVSGEFPDIFP